MISIQHEQKPAADGSASASPLAALVRQFWRVAPLQGAGILLLMLLVAALEGLGLLLLIPLLELVGVSTDTAAPPAQPPGALMRHLGVAPSLVAVLAIYVGLICLHAVAAWQRDVQAQRLQQGFTDHLRLLLFKAVGAAEWAFLARTHSAEFSHALTTDVARVSQAVHSLLQLATTGILAGVYVVVALRLSAPLAVTAVAVSAALLLVLHRHHRQAYTLGQGLTHSTQRIHASVTEYLAGLKLAKSSNAELTLYHRFAGQLRDARGFTRRFVHRQAVARGILRAGGALALAVLVYVALRILVLPATTVLVMVAIFARLSPLVAQLQQHYGRMQHLLPAYHSFTLMLSRCRREREPAGAGTDYTLDRSIRIERLHYRPAGASADLLQSVSVDIPARRTTALVGPSGAGKSTLADVLAGLLPPSAGRILADGRELGDRRAWRECVAYVPQETFLFNASVRDNLQWAGSADEAAIREALELAAADFVYALPQGLDTVLGERGIRLSGGERQRLAIARALLRKPLLLVLDEATSALDHANEQRIQGALERMHGHLTIVVIAHRLATIRHADRIVVLREGRGMEQGSYRELSADVGGYLSVADAGL